MGRPQQRIKRLVGKQTFTDNSRLVFDLPRDFDYESIVVRFYGTTTLSVAGTAVRAEAPLQIAKFINLKANGTDLLDGVSGIMAHRCGAFRRGQMPPLTPQAAATATAQAFAGWLILDRAVIDGIRAKDGNFPSRGLSTFQLEFLAGAAVDCFTGAPTGSITAGTVEVVAVQTMEQAGADSRVTLPRVVSKRTQLTIPFPASNANFQQRLNTGNLTRGLMLRAYGATTLGEPSDAVINNVKIQQGNQVLLDVPYATLRAMNAADMDVTTIPTGMAFVDFMNIGAPATKLSDSLDMRGGEEVWLYLDVNGGTNNAVDVATLEYMPFNPKYWGIAA
jgi:hypothetical protein